MTLLLGLLAAVAASVLPASDLRPAPADSAVVWMIDPAHSEVAFRVRHLIGQVRGNFTRFEGTITAPPGRWGAGSVQVTIEAASIDTRNDRRDTHLRSHDFFDVVEYPTITFRSTGVDSAGGHLMVEGIMRGVSRPVALETDFTGRTPDDTGGDRIGFEARGVINRNDFGVSYNRLVEGGGMLLGDDVEIELSVEAVRRPARQAGA